MKVKKYALLASVVLVAVACQDNKLYDNDVKPSGATGDEVQFGASLDKSPTSRTIYGPIADDKKSYPIWWLNGDQVFIASPDCDTPTDSATYIVTAQDGSEYAGSLSRLRNVGVQWGTKNQATFNSIYPCRNYPYNVTTEDCKNFTINMPSFQTCELETGSNPPKMRTADMYACFMYAQTKDVTKGEDVNLEYHPFSTALRFTLKGPGKDDYGKELSVTVTRVDLVAPSGFPLAGYYNVDLTNGEPVVKPLSGKTQSTVQVITRYKNQAYLELSGTQEIELNAFFMLADKNAEGDPVQYEIGQGWYIRVTLDDGTVLQKSIDGTLKTTTVNGETTTTTKTFTPHKIHILPELPPLKPGTAWNVANWMINIPRNVYLSEVSMPGAWCCTNKTFQNTPVGATKLIGQQYSYGVRAFHFDTRWVTDYVTKPVIGNAYTTSADVEKTNRLGIYDNLNTNADVDDESGQVVYSPDWGIKGGIHAVLQNMKSDEYMVILLTFAQGNYVRPGTTWMQGVLDAINNLDNTDKAKIFDGSTLSPNTVVKDVLGKAIIVVNCEKSPSGLTLPSGTNAEKLVYTYMPMLRSSGQYASTFKYDQDLMYYYSSESSKAESCGVNFLNTQAQVTSNTTGFDTNTGNPLDNIRPSRLGGWTGENRGFAPNINQRNTIGNNILAWSSTNLDRTSYSHSDWIFLGLGGYFIKPDQSLAGYNYKWSEVSGSASTVATNLNTWIYNKITDGTAMSTTLGYYPVGIVMMNRVEDYQQTAIKEIILLNNKFHKAFDPSKPAWP